MNSFAFVVLSLGLLGGTAAIADHTLPKTDDTFTVWGTSGDWTIYADANHKNCTIQRFDAALNAVQIGLTPDKAHPYLGVFTPFTEDMRGMSEKITVTVGDMERTGRVTSWEATDDHDYTGTYVAAENFDFLLEATKANAVIAYDNKQVNVEVSLEGASEAMAAAMECNKQLNP